jgi:hypothetical protein
MNIFEFTSGMWLFPGETTQWHFISVPKTDGESIKGSFKKISRGWGSLRVEARIGKTTWKTSIFPDKKRGTYILPIKADVRKKENLSVGDKVSVVLQIVE